MLMTALQSLFVLELAQADVVFQKKRSGDELRIAATIYTEAVFYYFKTIQEDTGAKFLHHVFIAYLRDSKYYPKPRDILEYVQQIRPQYVKAAQAVPEEPPRRTPGYGRSVCQKWLGRRAGSCQPCGVSGRNDGVQIAS